KRHVEHQAAWDGGAWAGQKLQCRCERLGLPACGFDQQLQRFAHGDVVVNDEDDGRDSRHLTTLHFVHVPGGLRVYGRGRWIRAHGSHVYVVPSAFVSALTSSSSLNGLKRHSVAPSANRRERTLVSPCAVMNTVGIACRRRINSRCRSGPDIPTNATSRMRHLVRLTNSDARNASADENAWTAKPKCRSKSGSDSRTDWSSSTTDTRERWTITNSPRRQPHPLRALERAEWKTRTWRLARRSVQPTGDHRAFR